MTGDLFPLPLTDIERFHFYRSSPRFPNVIYCRANFRGNLNRRAAEQAVAVSIRRQPLLCASVARSRGGRLQWIPSGTVANILDWRTGASHSPIPLLPIDVQQHPGVRVSVANRGENCEILLQVHHCAADGLGALSAMQDWLVIYGNIVNGLPPESNLRRLDLDLLRRRGQLGLVKWSFLRNIAHQWIALYGAAKFSLRRVTPLQPVTNSNSDESLGDHQQVITARLPPPTQASLNRLALKHQVTVHEIIVAQLFLALRRWRQQRGWHNSRDRLRIIVPSNIRELGDRRLPAANRITLIYLDRTDQDLENWAGLIGGIHYELGVIRKLRLEKTFLISLRLASFVPGWLKWSSSRRICRNTTFVTHLGAPFDRLRCARQNGKLVFGDIILDRFQPIPPVYELTPATFALSRYGDDFSFVLHFDPLEISAADARQLMDDLLQQLVDRLKQRHVT